MLSYNDLKPGAKFILDDEPYIVLEYSFLRMQQRKPVAQTKIKNLISGKIIQRNFHQNESFSEAEIEREPVVYIYQSKGEYWFHKKGNPGDRFKLAEDVLGNAGHFLKEKMEIFAEKFDDKIINVEIPIKMDLRVKEAPPAVKGNTAQGGSKEIILETGFRLTAPMFINEGDIIRVNTESGSYVERVEKA